MKTRSRRGAAAIEFALCLPVTVMLAAGIVDIGRAVSFRHTLQRAARDAARVGSAITKAADGTVAGEDEIEAAAIAHGAAALVAELPDCGTECVIEATWYTAPDDNEYLEVMVSAPQEPIFGLVPGLGGRIVNRFTVMSRIQEA